MARRRCQERHHRLCYKSDTPNGPGFVSIAERIASFDKDGMRLVEQPASP